MSDSQETMLSNAAKSVIAERERQVSGEGYSLLRDDLYVKGELAQAAGIYAELADSPGSSSTGWPWPHQAGYKPSQCRRRNLVKAGALILAEIERLDRAPLVLAPVQRDKDGWWSHPEFLAEYDDEITSEEYKSWCARKRIETTVTYMEGDVSPEVMERYGRDGQCSCVDWVIVPPTGYGWFMVSIHDSEDGPVSVWARRIDR